MDVATVLGRYQARIEELDALQAELTDADRPGDPGAIVGRLLEAAGDLLRRSRRLPVPTERIDAALKVVPGRALQSWVEAVSTQELKARLQRAADEAVEAALPDGPEEGETWAAWAMQGLYARDRAESARCALERLAASGRLDAVGFHPRLSAALEALDGSLQSRAAWFTALNQTRRAEASVLDPEHAARAWWFSLRSAPDDDGLVLALGSDDDSFPPGSPEAAVSSEVRRPRQRPVSFDELFRYDLGLASPAEVAFITSRQSSNPELALALAAMAEGERAIAELGADTAPRADPAPTRAADGAVVEERLDFKVLLFRRAQRVQLVVQPKRRASFAAAAVFLPDAPDLSRPSKAGEAGLEFDLGPEERLSRVTARVVVSFKSGQSSTIAVKL